MTSLFISYRRDDQAGFAGRLSDALASAFGADSVFRDIEDIRPGEDYVVALHKQLQGIDVMLVMIGPAWLSAHRNGVRRLDEPDDFVRMEIAAALESGKPVLPVLIGGAVMPQGKDLPAAIATLARHQAFVLSDASWSADVARLVESIRTYLPIQRQLIWRPAKIWALVGIILIALLALALNKFWPTPLPQPSRAPKESTHQLSGRWAARVNYDWGAVHDETFELALENGEVHGTASYLRVPRGIEQGELRDGRMTFVTHSQELLGDGARDLTHRYRAVVEPGELHFVLETSGSHSPHTPVEFVARAAVP